MPPLCFCHCWIRVPVYPYAKSILLAAPVGCRRTPTSGMLINNRSGQINKHSSQGSSKMYRTESELDFWTCQQTNDLTLSRCELIPRCFSDRNCQEKIISMKYVIISLFLWLTCLFGQHLENCRARFEVMPHCLYKSKNSKYIRDICIKGCPFTVNIKTKYNIEALFKYGLFSYMLSVGEGVDWKINKILIFILFSVDGHTIA